MFMGGGILFLVAGFCYTAALIDHNVLKGTSVDLWVILLLDYKEGLVLTFPAH